MYKFLVNQTRFVTKRFADFSIGDVLGVLTTSPLKKYSSPNLLPSQADSVGHVGVKVSDTTIRWGTPELFASSPDRYSTDKAFTTINVPPHQHYAVPTNVVVSVEF